MQMWGDGLRLRAGHGPARCCGQDSFPLKVAVYGRFLNVLKS